MWSKVFFFEGRITFKIILKTFSFRIKSGTTANFLMNYQNLKTLAKNKYIVKNKSNIIEGANGGTSRQNITGILNQGSGIVNNKTLNNVFMDKKFTKLSLIPSIYLNNL